MLFDSPVSNAPGTHLFVYGSLVDPRCLDEVLGHTHQGERLRATLSGFRRVADGTYPYPYIVTAPGELVDGVLVMDLSGQDLEHLDLYEEVEAGWYTRIPVEVETWGCGPRSLRAAAHTYVAGPRLRQLMGSEEAQPTSSTRS